MQGNAQRGSIRVGIGVSYRPGQSGRLSVTTTRGEASQSADRVSNGKTRREDVTRLEKRQTFLAHVEECERQGEDKAAIADAGGLQRTQRKNLGGILMVIRIQ